MHRAPRRESGLRCRESRTQRRPAAEVSSARVRGHRRAHSVGGRPVRRAGGDGDPPLRRSLRAAVVLRPEQVNLVLDLVEHPVRRRRRDGDVMADYERLRPRIPSSRWPSALPAGLADGLNGRWFSGNELAVHLLDRPSVRSATLGTFDAGHPLMQGVTSLNTDFLIGVGLAAGATQVAAWSKFLPLIAFKGDVVAINAYLGPEAQWTGQFARVIVNAFNWLCEGPPPTAPPPRHRRHRHAPPPPPPPPPPPHRHRPAAATTSATSAATTSAASASASASATATATSASASATSGSLPRAAGARAQARQREAADPQGQLLRRPRPPRSHQAIAARPRHRAEPEARRRQAQGLPGQPAGRSGLATASNESSGAPRGAPLSVPAA